MKREFRILPHAELRARGDGKPTGIEGYAAVFDQRSDNLGWFIEMVKPGAFTDTLARGDDVRCLFNHEASTVLGRTVSKTLSLREDAKGLWFDCTLPDTQAARDLLTSIGRGDIDQCSFGFYVRKQKWAEEVDAAGNTTYIREIYAVDLFDVSPVTFPAYPQTSVDTRTLWPDGVPRSVARFREAEPDGDEPDPALCECNCNECSTGDHENCSNPECNDVNCEHGAESNSRLSVNPQDLDRMRRRLELATRT